MIVVPCRKTSSRMSLSRIRSKAYAFLRYGLRADARPARDPGARARLRAGGDRSARWTVGSGPFLPARAVWEARGAGTDGGLRAGGVRRCRRGFPVVHPRARRAVAG